MIFRSTFIPCMVLLFVYTEAAQWQLKSMDPVTGNSLGRSWPSRRIPYTFTDLIDFNTFSRSRIEAVLRETETLLSVGDNKCIEFQPKDMNDESFILFMKKKGNWQQKKSN